METSQKTGLVLVLIYSLVIISTQLTTQAPDTYVCNKSIDIVFVIDGSNSLGDPNFKLIQNAISTAIGSLTISVNDSHVGAVLYSSGIDGVVDLKTDKAEFQREISNLEYPDQATYTNVGIDRATQMLDASRRENVSLVMIIITDGVSTDKPATLYSALVADSRGIDKYSIGVGNLTDQPELEEIATDGADQTFHLDSYLVLNDILLNLTRGICLSTKTPLPTTDLPTTPTTTTTTTTTPATTTTTTPATTTTTPTTVSSTSTSTTPPSTSATPSTPSPDSITAIDLCKNSPSIGGVGYVLYPGDCTKVLQCYYNQYTNKTLVVTRQCPSGQFWDQSCLKCIDSWKVDCPYDKCKNDPCYGNATATSTYPMAGVCGGFWSCENGRSYPKCCPPCYSYMVGYGCKFGNTCFDRCGPDVGCTDGLGVCEKIPEWLAVSNYALATDTQGLTTNTCMKSNLNIVDCKCQSKFMDTFMQNGQECKPNYESTTTLPCIGQQLSFPVKQNTEVGTVAFKIRINLNAQRFNITSTPVQGLSSNSAELMIWTDDVGIYASIGDPSNGGVLATILLTNLTGDIDILVMINQGLFTLGVTQDKFQQVTTVRAKTKKLCMDCIHNFTASSDNGGCVVNKVQVYSCRPEVTTIYVEG